MKKLLILLLALSASFAEARTTGEYVVITMPTHAYTNASVAVRLQAATSLTNWYRFKISVTEAFAHSPLLLNGTNYNMSAYNAWQCMKSELTDADLAAIEAEFSILFDTDDLRIESLGSPPIYFKRRGFDFVEEEE